MVTDVKTGLNIDEQIELPAKLLTIVYEVMKATSIKIEVEI